MRVIELAKDLKVETEQLLHLLREMGVAASGASSQITEADVSRVRLRLERERRAGKRDVSDAVQAAAEDASGGVKKRRRRVHEDAPSEPVAVEAAVPEAEPPAEVPAASEPVAEKQPEPEPVPDVKTVTSAPAEPVRVPEGRIPRRPSEDRPSARVEAAVEDVAREPESKPAPERFVPRRAAPEGATRVIKRPTPPTPAAPAAPPTPAASAGPGGQVRIQAEGYTADGRRKVKEKKKGKKRGKVDADAVAENLSRFMTDAKTGKKRRRRDVMSREDQELAAMEAEEQAERERKTVRVNEFLTVSELAELIDIPARDIVGSAFKNLRLVVTINQRLDFDQIEMLLDEFGFMAEREQEYVETEAEEEVEEAGDLQPRPPVVTVMGHVDHGKTMLLDRIRKTNVVAGESGGITQHIGAYHVQLPDGRSITFLDTPGHAAFTAMRARGAEVTDIVILTVAADDSVMPQTVEAISHAKNAGVPLIVAINKVDLATASPGRVKQELLQHDVQVEDFGGDVLSAEISAKTGIGIDDLLEKILLQAEMLDLKENANRDAQGTVIEAQLDVGKGPVVTVLVQKGTLRVGDSFLCGNVFGRVRALLDERGKSVSKAGPGIPVQVLGAQGVPQAGDTFQAMDADRAAEIAGTRQRLEREKQLRVKARGLKLGDFSQLIAAGQTVKLPLVIKGDVDGSVQAVADALQQLSTSEAQVEIIHRGVGAINESDVLLAETAGAVIIGFRVRPDTKARQLAERDDVEIQMYDVIYNAVNDIRSALEGLLTPEQKEVIVGSAEVREVFKITRLGTIAGCYVTEGIVDRKSKARVIRDGSTVYTGEIASLKRFKDDAREVREGFECGIGISNFNDLKVGDVIECFKVEEVARTLTPAGR